MDALKPIAGTRTAVGALLRAGPVWLAAGLVGWLLFRLGGGPALRGPLRWGLWLTSIALAVAVGAALQRALARREGPEHAWLEFAAIGWAVAIAAGWFLDVQVGGPVMGAVTAAALVGSAAPGLPSWRDVLVLAASLVGAAAGVELSGGRGNFPGLLGGILGAGAAVVAASALFGIGRSWGRVVLLIGLWGAAWYGAWALTGRLPAEHTGMLVVLSLEVALAIAVGGTLTGVVQGRGLLSSAVVALSAASIAVLVSALVDMSLGGLLPGALLVGSGRETWLDVGNVVALPFAAAIVLGPLLGVGTAFPRRPR
jgi:hypothetical protein